MVLKLYISIYSKVIFLNYTSIKIKYFIKEFYILSKTLTETKSKALAKMRLRPLNKKLVLCQFFDYENEIR